MPPEMPVEVVAVINRLDRISEQLHDIQQGLLVLVCIVILSVVFRYVASLVKD